MCISILPTIVSAVGNIRTCDIRAYYYIPFWQHTSKSLKYEIFPIIVAYNCRFGKNYEKPQKQTSTFNSFLISKHPNCIVVMSTIARRT